MSTTMMTQESLTQLLTERGWEVEDLKTTCNKQLEDVYPGDIDPVYDMRKGISIHATSPTEYTLSLQAGLHNYSEPRLYVEEYESLEFAITHDCTNIWNKDKPFIKDYRLHEGNDDVVGWADFNKVMKAVEIIENWTRGKGPAQTPVREKHLWDTDD